MCGIAGVLYRDHARSPDLSVLKKMGNAIAHRGPDGSGVLQSGSAGLIHRRLAIIDLEGGCQPIANEDESIQVVFNGEIYNHRELRTDLEQCGHRFRTNSDTEVLVHLYEEFGGDMCLRLRGMFSFALWDVRRQELFLARDHLGQKPLFVYRDDEKILFASELKGILAHPNVDNRIDPAAIEDYLAFGFVPGSSCILRSVQKLPAAHRLTVSHSRWNADPERYWQLQFDAEAGGSESDWAERIDAGIRSSVKAHLVSDVPVGAFLSGGLDSSAIVAMVAELSPTPLQTFSIGFHEEEFSELPEAETVANFFGCRHTTKIVTPDAVRDLDELTFLYDEPFADASAIPTMAVSRLAAERVKVVLSGDGGDELFGGYWRYGHDLQEDRIRRKLPTWFRQTVLRSMSFAWPRTDWLPRHLRLQSSLKNLSLTPAAAYANTISACRSQMRPQLLNTEFSTLLNGHRPEETVETYYAHGGRDALSGMLSADTNVLLPDDFLAKVDRASMGFGLEVRPPFVDRPLMELAASMPSEFKIRKGSRKWILKQIFESRLPKHHVHRKKKGFDIPIDAWLRGPLKDQVHEVVLNPQASIAQFIDTRFARRLYTSHCNRQGRHGQLIWSLLVLGRWLDRWQTTPPLASVSSESATTQVMNTTPAPAGQEVSV
jgi:asparagine synthase (glutamine-hydrolysing)